MTKIEKDKRKQIIKDRLFKVLHTIAYILSVCFIGLCIFAGCQSCQKSSSVSAESETDKEFNLAIRKLNNIDLTDYYSLTARYTVGSHTISLDDQIWLADGVVDLVYADSTGTATDYYQYIYTPSMHEQPSYLFYGHALHEIQNIVMRWYPYTISGTQGWKLYRLYSFDIYTYDDGSHYLCLKRPDTLDGYTYEFQSGDRLLLSQDLYNVHGISYFYEKEEHTYFTFNDSFNYNAPMMLPYGNQLWQDSSVSGTFEQNFYSDLNVGWFYSNGFIFDTIRYTYRNSNGMKFYNSVNDTNPLEGNNGLAFYYGMYYYNSFNGDSWLVNTRDIFWKSSLGVPEYCYLSTTTWRDSNFRKIIFLENLSQDNYVLITSFNNNQPFNGNGFISNGATTDVFILLSTAFTSLNDFWIIQILPGITIGTLFFLPLVVCIVMTVFYMVKR